MLKKISIFLLLTIITLSGIYYKTIIRLYDGFVQNKISKERAKLYILTNGNNIQDITQQLISDKSIPDDLKQPLIRSIAR